MFHWNSPRKKTPPPPQADLKDEEISALLRLAVVRPDEPEHSHFEQRVVRRWRVASAKQNVGYWMPAVFGAVTAAIAIVAVLQIVSTKPEARSNTVPSTSEARLRERPISFEFESTAVQPK